MSGGEVNVPHAAGVNATRAREHNYAMASCSHLDTIEVLEVPDEVAGCEDCLLSLRLA
jgi:hypothetical protein